MPNLKDAVVGYIVRGLSIVINRYIFTSRDVYEKNDAH